MYACPHCRRRWLDENAEANGYRCYRACDAALIRMEDSSGPHLDHLPDVILGVDSGIDNLREAIQAVQPGGTVACPPSRHTEPLYLDKPVTICRRDVSGQETFIQVASSPAIRVVLPGGTVDRGQQDGVTLEGLTLFRGTPAAGDPLVAVESGVLRLEGCRVDCRGGPGIIVRSGARLVMIDTEVIGPAGYGVHCEEGGSLEIRGGRIAADSVADGVDDGDTGEDAAIVVAGEAACDIEGVLVAGHARGLVVREASAEVSGATFEGNGVAVSSTASPELNLAGCTVRGVGRTLTRFTGGRVVLASCRFEGGDIQIAGDGVDLMIDQTTFHAATVASVDVTGDAPARIVGCTFDQLAGNAIQDRASTVSVEDSEFTGVSGAVLLAAEKGAVIVRSCRIQRCGLGLYAVSGQTLTVEDSTITGAVGSAVIIQQGAVVALDRVSVSGSGADQIVIGSGDDCHLADCRIEDGRFAGVSLCDGARLRMADCVVAGNGAGGVVVGRGAALTAARVEFRENVAAGLMAGPAGGVDITGGVIAGNRGPGGLFRGAGLVRAAGVTLESNAGDGLFLDQVTAIALDDLSVTGNEGNGITVVGHPGSTGECSGEIGHCRIDGNDGDAVVAVGHGRVMIRESELTAHGGGAFLVWGDMSVEFDGVQLERGAGTASRAGRGARLRLVRSVLAGRGSLVSASWRSKLEFDDVRWPGRWQWLSRLRSVRRIA